MNIVKRTLAVCLILLCLTPYNLMADLPWPTCGFDVPCGDPPPCPPGTYQIVTCDIWVSCLWGYCVEVVYNCTYTCKSE